jgi:hypothetical protein
MTTRNRFSATHISVLLTGLLLLPGEALAQADPRIGIGFVGNFVEQPVGVSVHALTSWLGGIGLYLDGKVSASSPRDRDNFNPDMTAGEVENQVGDQFFSDDRVYRSLNSAVLVPITPELMMYAGAGITWRETYVEYHDPNLERGNGGFYWVADPEADTSGLNVLAGGIFRIGSRVGLHLGIEGAPRGATVGASYAVPLR